MISNYSLDYASFSALALFSSHLLLKPLTPKKWQPGDPIVEAQTLIITADGRGLLTTAKQAQLADPKSLVCSTEQAESPTKRK